MNHNSNTQPRRSFIFTPGLKPEMYPKALKSGTDMVCIELEDGIAPQDKEIARNLALKLFQEKQENDGVERILRINSLRENNIQFGMHYKPNHLLQKFKINYSLRISESSYKEIITLPIHPEISISDVEKICKIINNI